MLAAGAAAHRTLVTWREEQGREVAVAKALGQTPAG